ncbi:ABC transporter ATP-binding protein [bacterium C-53]|nr:ABC transporter ATP-binding protein [Lachnospiraceae bacterium]NBI01942.1 ABC transporter ATP-binding protein [Lachnospiraceae bacterium]RKJ12342.1 ABC transporter ATP-binding protein [bacterium C-53]
MSHILSLQNAGVSYHSLSGETIALQNISFHVEEGEFLSIVGPSGCGKSTLLSIIAGLVEPEEGSITTNGCRIGYMLQRDHLFEWRTVLKNILLGPEISHCLTLDKRILADRLLKQYGLYPFKDKYPSELSGGMRQRAALIRTLVMEPDLLLLDEPFSALDYQTRLNVSDDIYRIIREEHKTAILVTHDLSEAISLGERIVVLTKRPGTIKDIITIDLSIDNEERTPLLSRDAPEFKTYFNLLWKELNT